MGRKFLICTNQRSLKFLMEQRWWGGVSKVVEYNLGFEFEIQYNPGFSNKVADAVVPKIY